MIADHVRLADAGMVRVLGVLDAAAVRRWAVTCVDALEASREEIDRINVYPVADGDTGTNLLHTMRAALEALVRTDITDAGTAVAALARGALAGARGNSGVILSQVLRGLAEEWAGATAAGGEGIRKALVRADALATAAVAEPAPGTILTVLHAAAVAARECDGDDLAEVVVASSKAAADALAETPRQLSALAKAGVVDAGGRGLVVLLDALAEVVTGERVERALGPHRLPRLAEDLHTEREGGSTEFEYEVMYLLDGGDERRTTTLRAELAALGDCVSVVSDGTPDGAGLWTVHVHCNDVGAAIEAGVEAGRPHRITVVRFADQIEAAPKRFVRDRAVVAIVDGEGIAELFRSEGAVVVTVPPAQPLDTADLLAAISGSRAAHVVLLPNSMHFNVVVDEACAQATQAGQDVVAVPTASAVQGLAALAVHDPARRPGDDVVAMAEAAAATRRGELLIAQREALTWVGRCQPGDVLGMVDGEVVLIEPASAVTSAACQLADRMLAAGGELVTAVLGAGAPDGVAEALAEHLRHTRPEVELAAYPGGQLDAVLLLGVE
ncbi:DAK2 domain-containing protein [Allokutzneria sp. A3M-2-11 16]|uniref:DAK2 domain-containing protein n=1 Tax=Allokutzneria sp. A3M-2-11 16 TaxID=2962043 RepID=UPI0027E2B17D|nr:DAK2 domain-containing protein [Allokutzneria sp. A3M-2-11 16]